MTPKTSAFKNQIRTITSRKLLLLLIVFSLMTACSKQEKNTKVSTSDAGQKIKTADVEFIDYWDKYDQRSFFTLKEGKEFSLVFSDSISRDFNRGDLLEIKWDDSDTVRYDKPLLVSANRIKEGNLSVFLKKHKLGLQYSWNCECTGALITKSYSIVEYYFSVTQNEKAKEALDALSGNDPTKEVKIGNKVISYVVDKEITLEGKKLVLLDIGIFTYGGTRTKIQDIYFENESYKIYELDPDTHKLIEIK